MRFLAGSKTAAAIFGILVAFFLYRTGAPRDADIEGYVFESCVNSRSIGPVRAASVSTSIDSTTATTDTNGHFHLRTTHPVFVDEYYTFTVTTPGVIHHETRRLESRSAFPIALVLSAQQPVFLGRRAVSDNRFPEGFICQALGRRADGSFK
jgi:hypothetical protein